MDDNFLPSLKHSLTNLVNWLENTNTNVDNFKILDTSLEDWNDILEKSSKILGGLHKIYNLAQLYAFKKFLKGISSQIRIDNPLTPKDKEKLDDYLCKENNISFIYNTIRKSLTANSLKCTELLGIIVGKLLREQIEMTQENIIIINALHSLTDYDLNNFYKIYKIIFQTEKNRIRLDKLYIEIKKEEIEISIISLVNSQVLFQDFVTVQQGMRWGDENIDPLNTIMKDSEKFISINNISHLLFELLEETKGEILFLG